MLYLIISKRYADTVKGLIFAEKYTMSWFFTILIILIFVGYIYNKGTKKQGGEPKKKKVGGYAQWVGGGLGWTFGGPIGGILGFAFGRMFEDMRAGSYSQEGSTLQGDFKVSLLVLSAAVMKADGSVKRTELDFVKRFLVANFGVESAESSVLMLREILKQPIDVQEVGRQIGKFMDYPSRLQLLHYLFGIAKADGRLPDVEIRMIASIAAAMGVSPSDFGSLKAMFVKETDSAYKILEMLPTATDDEVKKAYREMAVKYHPDKVSHLGDDVRKAAEQKFKEVSSAYDQIKNQRGIK